MTDYEQAVKKIKMNGDIRSSFHDGHSAESARKKTRLETLVSCVDENVTTLPMQMNIGSDCVIVNECREEAFSRHMYAGYTVRCFHLKEKGVGLSRNTALQNSEAEFILFADEDIVYNDGYAGEITGAFDSHPGADILLFNVEQSEGRKTYHIKHFGAVGFLNYGRYPAYAIAARTKELKEAGVKFSLLFGGGAKYSNGEDSLFLHDCLKKRLHIFAVPVEIGHEKKRESTWFKGYTEKFFFDRGVLYKYLYGKYASVMGFRFLLKNKKTMCAEKSFGECYTLLKKGIEYAGVSESDYPYADGCRADQKHICA